jgi:hypothetical protein
MSLTQNVEVVTSPETSVIYRKTEFLNSSSSYMALQPISGLGLLFMRFRNLTLIDNWKDSLDE